MSIGDNGNGIPPALMPRLFEMFCRGDSSVGATPGLGIGLALARRLAELHGGSISARSEGPGKGSEFVVRLPPASAPAQAPPALPADDLGGEQILVVDDNVDAAESLAALLLGAQVRVASDGRAALAAFGASPPRTGPDRAARA